jgi:uncharacterized protein YkwD
VHLAAVAAAHNEDMRTRGYFDHDSPEGETPEDRLMRAGVPGYGPGSWWGENLSYDLNVASAFAGDMQDTRDHPGTLRSNIVDSAFTRIGISVLQLTDNNVRIVVLFLQ